MDFRICRGSSKCISGEVSGGFHQESLLTAKTQHGCFNRRDVHVANSRNVRRHDALVLFELWIIFIGGFMDIRRYNKNLDEDKIMKIIEDEGDEWECYSGCNVSGKYREALSDSITYVAYEGEKLCGYSRSIDDCGFYIYVCDLLVSPTYRGRSIGRRLMECIYSDFPGHIVYVMSDVDEYYKKQGYKYEGSIFEVTNTNKRNSR